MNDIIFHAWLAFMLFTCGGCLEVIRRLCRRARISRGNLE
jgi:hypothetical protein